jgi:hypothetical protein
MAATTRVVEYDQGGVKARLVVAQATVRMGIERQAMQEAARRHRDEMPRVGLLRLLTWPDLVASTVDGAITVGETVRPVYDLTFDEWLDLPEALVMEWESAVYALNPHWLPSPPTPPPRQRGES